MGSKNINGFLIAIAITLAASGLALGQDSVALSVAPSALRALETGGIVTGAIAEGQKLKIEGAVIDQNNQTLTIRDAQGSETVVVLTDKTLVQKKRKGWFYGPRTCGAEDIRVGLTLKVDGRGNSDGQLVAKKIIIAEPDPKTLKALQSGVRLFGEPADSPQAADETRIGLAQEAPIMWRTPPGQHCGKCSQRCGEGCTPSNCSGQSGCS